jgi:hypothetical protein
MAEPVVDEYLAHFGVKGMHWGKHTKSSSSSSSAPTKTRSELRSLNKTARAENKAKAHADRKKAENEHDAKVMKARDRVEQDAINLKNAKKQYKTDKKVIGKVAAKRIVKEHEDKFTDSFNTAMLNTTKEQHQVMIASAGILALSAIGSGLAAVNNA